MKQKQAQPFFQIQTSFVPNRGLKSTTLVPRASCVRSCPRVLTCAICKMEYSQILVLQRNVESNGKSLRLIISPTPMSEQLLSFLLALSRETAFQPQH
jgi:hypothetical protein